MKKLERSDIVRLASGGPWMSVAEILPDERAVCVWFDGEEFQKDTFDFAVLMRPA